MSTTTAPQTRKTRATTTRSTATVALVVAFLAAILAATALAVALDDEQPREQTVALDEEEAQETPATAAPAPPEAPAEAECAPIRIAPASADTEAGSMDGAIAAIRVAAPDLDVKVLDLRHHAWADLRVGTATSVDESYPSDGAPIIRVPSDDRGTIALAALLPTHLPGCDGQVPDEQR